RRLSWTRAQDAGSYRRRGRGGLEQAAAPSDLEQGFAFAQAGRVVGAAGGGDASPRRLATRQAAIVDLDERTIGDRLDVEVVEDALLVLGTVAGDGDPVAEQGVDQDVGPVQARAEVGAALVDVELDDDRLAARQIHQRAGGAGLGRQKGQEASGSVHI